MNKGVLYGIIAYVLWGMFPVYFKLIANVPPAQVTAHRIVWSFLLMALLISMRHQWRAIRSSLTWRIALIYGTAGVLLTTNWLTYIWAVQSGYVVEGSLGYFINPMVSVLMGIVFLRERLRPLQWIPVGLAALGVIVLTISYGTLPWIALVLAFSFGSYGLMKKLAPLDAIHSVTLETVAVLIPALGYLLLQENSGGGAFVHLGWSTTLLLISTGVVTAIPLLLFAGATRIVPLTSLGLLQYITPTMHFLFGVFLYNEPFDHSHLIGFSIIWLALLIFSIESFVQSRRTMANPKVVYTTEKVLQKTADSW